MSAPTIHASSGRHDRVGYIRRLVSLWRAGKSGIFQVRFGRRRQKLFILSGGVVACRAYMESEAARSVRLVGPEGIGAAMSWATGEWSFQPMAAAASGVDPGLHPAGAMAELWRSVCQSLPASEAMVALSERGDEAILPGPELADCLPAFALPAPLDGLAESLGAGASVEVLFRAFPDYGPELARAIWMLDAAGLLDPEDGAYVQCVRALMDVRPVEEAASLISAVGRSAGRSRPQPGDAPASPPVRPAPRAPSRDLTGVLAAEHARRMGRDYYGFLGIAANAPQLLVDRICKRYIQRWRSASANHSLPDEARAQARDLFAAIQQVAEVLTDPARRRDYDRLLARGSAPVVRPGELPSPEDSGPPSILPPVDAPPAASTYERGRLLLERGEYAAAVRYLRRARMEAPSEPDILADLGWVTWMLQGTDEAAVGGEDPEEYIQLAMTFDRLNPRALEYLARIAMAGEDRDEQQRRLKDLLRVAPETEWAREALKSLMFARKEPAPEGGGRGLLFWRKGGSH